MKRCLNTLVAATMTFLALVLLMPARSYAQPAPTSPVEVVKAVFAAQNANDPAAMRRLIAPDAAFVQPSFGPPGSNVQTRDDFIAGVTGANNSQVTATSVQQTAPDTVSADVVVSGGDTPRLPHPFHLQTTITVVGGVITHAVITLSPETQQDIAALGPQPGMPTTGADATSLPLAWAGLGLLFLLAGAFVRCSAHMAPGSR